MLQGMAPHPCTLVMGLNGLWKEDMKWGGEGNRGSMGGIGEREIGWHDQNTLYAWIKFSKIE